MERQKFLKPGDVVEVEVEGIGTLRTPFKALSAEAGDAGLDWGPDRPTPSRIGWRAAGAALLG